MRGRSYDPVKRLIDLIVGSVLLGLSLPLQAVVAVVVRLRLGSPVLFRQPRLGKDDEVFDLVKFRSMCAPDQDRGLISDEQRLTPFGTWLRSTSLDELPTLWNVLRGDMSLVGPRPLLVTYLERYSSEQRRRHEVRPGVTGLAQVRGRNQTEWEERLRLDVEYVDTRSPVVDLKIMAATLGIVLGRRGVSGEGTVTMTEFKGAFVEGPRSASQN